MAIVVTLAPVNPGLVSVGDVDEFIVTISNTGTAALTLTSLSVNGDKGWNITQPLYLTPNVAVGVGNPVIGASSSASYIFQACANSPVGGFAPAGGAPTTKGATPNSVFPLQAIVQMSDGTVASSSTLIPVLSAIPMFPIPDGGALVQTQGANLVNLLTL